LQRVIRIFPETFFVLYTFLLFTIDGSDCSNKATTSACSLSAASISGVFAVTEMIGFVTGREELLDHGGAAQGSNPRQQVVCDAPRLEIRFDQPMNYMSHFPEQ
jgi:hypothetical protein